MRILPRTLFGCALAGFGLTVGACAGVATLAGLLGTEVGNRWLLGQVELLGSAATEGGSLEIGTLRLGRRGLLVTDFALRDPYGRPLIAVDQVVADLRLGRLWHRELSVPHLRVEGVLVDLTADQDGVTDLSRLLGGPSTAPPSDEPFRLPIAIAAPDVEVRSVNVRYANPDGTVLALTGLSGTAAVHARGSKIGVSRIGLVGQVAEPGPVPARITGDLVYDDAFGLTLGQTRIEVPHGVATVNGTFGDDVNLAARVDRLEARALDPFAADAGIGGVWSGNLTAEGTDRQFEVTAAVRGIERTTGAVSLAGTVDRTREVPDWTATALLQQLHVEQAYTPLEEEVVLDGLVEVAGSGTSLQSDLVLDGTWEGGSQVLYGQPVDRVNATFALADGVLHLADSRMDGIVGDLTLSGDVDLVRGPVDVRARGPLSPDRLAALGAEGLTGDGFVDARVRTDLKADRSVVEVGGSIRYAPFVYPNVTIAELDAPFTTVVRDGVVTGSAVVRGAGLDASGLTGETLASERVSFEVVGERTTVSGPLAITNVDYDGYLTAARVEGGFVFGLADEHTRLTADVALTEYTLLQRPGTDGALSLAMQDDDLRYTLHLADYGRPVLDILGTYDLASAEVVLESLRFAPTPRATWLARRPVRMRLTDGGITEADLLVGSELGEIELQGQIGTEGPLDAVVGVRDLQLDHLAELYPESLDGLAGALDLDLRLGGDAADPVADARVDLKGLFVQDSVRWLDVTGPVRLAGGQLRPELALGVAGDVFGHLSGAAPLSGGLADLALDPAAPADLQLALTPGGLDRLAHVAPALDDTELPPGRFSAVVEVTEALADPVLRLAGVTEVAVPEWDRPGRVEFDLTRRASELTLDADLRHGLQTRATVSGEAVTRLQEVFGYLVAGVGPEPAWDDPELYVDRIAASAALAGVPVDSLAAAAGSDVEVSGEVVGGITVSGSPTRPVVEGALNWIEPRLGNQRLKGGYLSLVPRAAAPGGQAPGAPAADPAAGAVGEGGAGGAGVASSGAADAGAGGLGADELGAGGGRGAGDAAGGAGAPGTWAGYAVELLLSFPNGSLEVAGDVPVVVDLEKDPADWKTGELALDVGGDGVPLAVLTAFDPEVRGVAGRLVLDGHIGGTLDAIDPELVASLEKGRLGYQALGVVAEDITLHASVADRRVTLDRLDFRMVPNKRFQPLGLVSDVTSFVGSGFSEGGQEPRISVEGSAALDEQGLPGEVQARVVLRDGPWLFSTEDNTLRANGALEVAGQWPALAVDGDLDLVYGRLKVDTASLAGATPLELDSTLTVVRGGQPIAPERPPEEPPIYADFTVDLGLDLKRNLEVAMAIPFLEDLGEIGADLSRLDLAARLGGQLRLGMADAQPSVVGRVEVVQGSARILRSSLALEDGSITFPGGDPYQTANLDLNAVMAVGAGELEVAISGTPMAPEVVPSSREFPDRTQQLAILLTGQAPEELTSLQGAAATQALAQTVLSSLLTGRSLGTLSIEPDNSVRLGVPLSPRLFGATTVRPMVTDPDENVLSFELEWSPARRLVLSGGIGDQIGWGDVFWEVRF